MEALIGVGIGAFLAHFFSEERTRKSRQAERKALATALLVEMRTLEVNLRRLYEDSEAARWRGAFPSPTFDELGLQQILFSPNTIQEIAWFHSMIRDARLVMDDYWRFLDQGDEALLEDTHWHVRARCFQALTGMPVLKASLEDEGGSVPDHDTLALPTLERPELPPIPERVFEEP